MEYTEINGMGHFEMVNDLAFRKFDSGIFIEIGTWVGRNTACIASKIKELNRNIKFYAIDTFKGDDTNPDKVKQRVIDEYSGDFYSTFINNMKLCEVEDYVIPIRKLSLDALDLFEDSSVDFIFMDDHNNYNTILSEISAWYKKIKPGGIISGNDYIHRPDSVARVVNELFPDRQLISVCWYYEKPIK